MLLKKKKEIMSDQEQTTVSEQKNQDIKIEEDSQIQKEILYKFSTCLDFLLKVCHQVLNCKYPLTDELKEKRKDALFKLEKYQRMYDNPKAEEKHHLYGFEECFYKYAEQWTKRQNNFQILLDENTDIFVQFASTKSNISSSLKKHRICLSSIFQIAHYMCDNLETRIQYEQEVDEDESYELSEAEVKIQKTPDYFMMALNRVFYYTARDDYRKYIGKSVHFYEYKLDVVDKTNVVKFDIDKQNTDGEIIGKINECAENLGMPQMDPNGITNMLDSLTNSPFTKVLLNTFSQLKNSSHDDEGKFDPAKVSSMLSGIMTNPNVSMEKIMSSVSTGNVEGLLDIIPKEINEPIRNLINNKDIKNTLSSFIPMDENGNFKDSSSSVTMEESKK